jgi:uncharacterized protein (TIRG00374 family)
MRRKLWRAAQLVVSCGVVAFLLWRMDLGHTVDLIGSSNGAELALALAIQIGTTWLMAWRWQLLLAAKGIREPLGWLTRLYFVGYAAGQVLPTGVGGDAVRILEHSRRRPEARAEAAGAVIMERAIGSAGTLVMVAIGLAFAVGRYDDIALFVWVEIGFVVGMAVAAALMFSRRAAAVLERHFPRLRRLERPIAGFYAALHGYRSHAGALLGVLAVTLVMQFVRILGIWLCGEAVGLDLSPLVYVVLGPMLFLVMMVPFTINGLGVREAFFVAFLTRFGVSTEAAFATGFLFYAVTIATSLPGGVIMLWRSVRPAVFRARRA